MIGIFCVIGCVLPLAGLTSQDIACVDHVEIWPWRQRMCLSKAKHSTVFVPFLLTQCPQWSSSLLERSVLEPYNLTDMLQIWTDPQFFNIDLQFIFFDGFIISLVKTKICVLVRYFSLYLFAIMYSQLKARCKTCLTAPYFTDSSHSVRIMKAAVLKITARKQSVAL